MVKTAKYINPNESITRVMLQTGETITVFPWSMRKNGGSSKTFVVEGPVDFMDSLARTGQIARMPSAVADENKPKFEEARQKAIAEARRVRELAAEQPPGVDATGWRGRITPEERYQEALRKMNDPEINPEAAGAELVTEGATPVIPILDEKVFSASAKSSPKVDDESQDSADEKAAGEIGAGMMRTKGSAPKRKK